MGADPHLSPYQDSAQSGTTTRFQPPRGQHALSCPRPGPHLPPANPPLPQKLLNLIMKSQRGVTD